jgi:hypothetical protein
MGMVVQAVESVAVAVCAHKATHACAARLLLVNNIMLGTRAGTGTDLAQVNSPHIPGSAHA